MLVNIASDVMEFSISSNARMDEHGRTVRKTFARFVAGRYAIAEHPSELPPVFEISLDPGFVRESNTMSRTMCDVSVRIVDREIQK